MMVTYTVIVNNDKYKYSNNVICDEDSCKENVKQ